MLLYHTGVVAIKPSPLSHQVTNLNLLLPDAFTPKRMALAFHNAPENGNGSGNGSA
jgi:hypothetical protein